MAVRVSSSLFTSIIGILLLAILVVSKVDASATFKVQMIRYENPSSKNYDGSCCDLFCWSHCDHVFRFALDVGNSDNNPRGSHYWSHTTGEFADQNSVSFGANMKGVTNPIVTLFNPRWPSVGVKLKVFVKEEDGIWSGDDDVDGFVQLLRLTPGRGASTASWTQMTLRGLRPSHKTSLTLRYKLYCDPNYYSSDCSIYCIARDSDTHGHYTCDPATGNIVCRPGWEDIRTRCRTRSNDCLGHRCRNGATCVDGVRTYTCHCPPGYSGFYCQVNVNECASQPCLNGGTCTDLVASYRCTCPPAYTGRTCATPYCLTNNPCRNGGTCYGAGLCRCLPGFVGSDCSMDLCQMVTCHNGGTCVNGSCVCPVGIAGSTCDVDICDLTVCLNGGICQSGVCRCASGFTGAVCETNLDECVSSPCQNGGTCYDLVDGYSCSCTPEYTGRTCSTPYCSTVNPCLNGGTCHGVGRCACRPGFVGADCSIARCDLLDCQNGGSCVDGSCVCPPGIIGANCDIVQCSLMMCMNGGTCSEGRCTCPPGFTGRLCEVDIDDCVGDPCQHDGTCDDHPNGFTCRCLPGFAGKLCSETVSHANNVTKSTSIIYANNSSSNSTYIMYESTEDQPSGQMDAVDAWFFTSLVIIFVLLVIIIILSICLCCKRRNGTMTLESDKPPAQPTPEPAVAASADRAVENDYYSIKKHSATTTTTVSVKLNGDDDDDDDVDDPLYESISGAAAGSVRSDTSPDASPEPYDKLHVPELCESSDL